MIRDGDLAGFRLGKLIRIPAAEVDRYECQSLILSPDTEEFGPSPTEMKKESAFESRLARMTGGLPTLELARSGRNETHQEASN
jgi:hypothetical protein